MEGPACFGCAGASGQGRQGARSFGELEMKDALLRFAGR